MPRPKIESLAEAFAYIAELEDALQPFAPFAVATAVPMRAEFTGTLIDSYALRRDTAYMDMSPFIRAAELTRGLA